jgi:hypothetical protein
VSVWPAAASTTGATVARKDVRLENRAFGLAASPVRAQIAFYLAADKLFAKAADVVNANIAEMFVNTHLRYFSIAVFVIALVGTPLYIRQQATDQKNRPVRIFGPEPHRPRSEMQE